MLFFYSVWWCCCWCSYWCGPVSFYLFFRLFFFFFFPTCWPPSPLRWQAKWMINWHPSTFDWLATGWWVPHRPVNTTIQWPGPDAGQVQHNTRVIKGAGRLLKHPNTVIIALSLCLCSNSSKSQKKNKEMTNTMVIFFILFISFFSSSIL